MVLRVEDYIRGRHPLYLKEGFMLDYKQISIFIEELVISLNDSILFISNCLDDLIKSLSEVFTYEN